MALGSALSPRSSLGITDRMGCFWNGCEHNAQVTMLAYMLYAGPVGSCSAGNARTHVQPGCVQPEGLGSGGSRSISKVEARLGSDRLDIGSWGLEEGVVQRWRKVWGYDSQSLRPASSLLVYIPHAHVLLPSPLRCLLPTEGLRCVTSLLSQAMEEL